MSNTAMSSMMGVIRPGAFDINHAGSAAPHKEDNTPIINLKNGKVAFKQKPYSLEKMSETMQETVKFRDFLHERSKVDSTPLQRIPDEHFPLVAKLVYESDKTLANLTKQVQQTLVLEDDEDKKAGAVVLGPAVESAITSVAERVNYGIDWTEKSSASLSIWRWEVKNDNFDLLPRAAKEKVESRVLERRQAKRQLRALYDELPESERVSLGKTTKKSQVLAANDENKTTLSESSGTSPSKDVSVECFNVVTEEKKIVGRPKKERDPDQIQKENELAEKRAAKLEKERRKEENQSKSRSIMSNFFSKPKTNSKLLRAGPSSKSPIISNPSSSKSDFERSFKPYIVKKHAKMAPINFFRSKTMSADVIDLEEPSDLLDPKSCIGPKLDVNYTRSAEDSLAELKKSMHTASRPMSQRRNTSGIHYKSSTMYCIRDIMSQLVEAEVIGKDEVVRELQELLQDRRRIPTKAFIFEEDSRPGYFGTFTKSSTTVGPRTPFARDPVAFDYSYDSGEEWEEEGEGDDLLSGHGSDVEASSDVGSDEMEGWLVEDEDVGDPGTPLSEREGSPSISLPSELQVKRKAEADKQKKEMKKRKVVPLIPFVKENRLEDRIGDCDNEVFIPFRLQLFNDTPFPIDPFTFVSEPIKPQVPSKPQQQFAVPAVPAHIQVPISGVAPIGVQAVAPNYNAIPVAIPAVANVSDPLKPQNTFHPVQYQGPIDASQTTPLKRAPMQPKTPFPAALMPYLADKVASLNSGNLTWLVESLYQDLKTHGVRKIAIEAKIREDCEKCPQRRIWIVKNDVLISLRKAASPQTA